MLKLGIDLGSTTAKLIVLDALGKQVYSIYRRHHAETRATLQEMLSELQDRLGDEDVSVMFTGSAGMGISESCGLPFLQEVIAAAEVIKRFPNVHTLIDIGGEDAKMIFFEPGLPPDIRMNGSCAGGTGAFIDQMAMLLNMPVEDAGGGRELSQHSLPHRFTLRGVRENRRAEPAQPGYPTRGYPGFGFQRGCLPDHWPPSRAGAAQNRRFCSAAAR